MTRTYHDIEAVTHLLEEKERDLELAARIGQTLLQKNKELTQRNELLEEQLAVALDEVSQLKHELSLKDDLLHTYADDDTDSSGAPSPVKELRNFGRSGMYNHIESLQVKIRKLEEENNRLKMEHMKYQNENEDLESEEQQIVSDAFKELGSLRVELKEARENNKTLSEELAARNEEANRQQEEITRLLTQLVDMQRKQKQLALENEELQQHLTAANATQYELTREVQALEEKCQEVTNMLGETREEARLLRECPDYYGQSVPFGDSLAAELECSDGVPTETINSQDSNPLSFTATPIKWSCIVDGEAEDNSLRSGGKELSNHVVQSEPRPKRSRSDSLSQRVLSMARYVNNAKNYSMDSKFKYATPKKQARPIPTPLPIPGSNRSMYIHGSTGSTPSSGRCMSSTPHKHGYSYSLPLNSFNPTPKYASLRLRLANKSLAKAKYIAPISCKYRRNCDSVNRDLDKPSNFKPNRSMSDLKIKDEVVKVRAEWTWHGESAEFLDSQRNGFATPSLGRPGIPGTEDLERAIRKLALRRENARYMEMEKHLAVNDKSFDSLCSSGRAGSLRSGGRTPPPSPPGSPKLSRKRLCPTRNTKLPKLRIVKPLEGSATLSQWKYLAERDRNVPPLQTKFDVSPGIITRDRVVEALSKSRDGSLNSSRFVDETKATLSHVTPLESTQIGEMGDFPQNVDLHRLQVMSSPLPSCICLPGAVLSVSANTYAHAKDVPQVLPICPGGGLPLTSTRYIFINSRVMNPTDYPGTSPCCNPMVQYCNTTYASTRLVTSVAGATHGNTKESSTLRPSLFVQHNAVDEANQAMLARKFYKESTRTCSMQLGLAELFHEHSVVGLQEESSREPFVDADARDSDSPPLMVDESSSTLASSATNSRSSSHIVWNRSLQRTFLLPSVLPSREILFNLNRHSGARKPDTPTNSPLTSVPSSASFLLNEILAETPTTTVAAAIGKEESLFSMNLLSKLAQIGWMRLQGLGESSKVLVATSVSASPTYTISATSRANAVSSTSKTQPNRFMSRCATAPGSLRSQDDTYTDSTSSLRRLPSRNVRRPVTSVGADDGVELKPIQSDWAELHGSSGALNLPAEFCGEGAAEVMGSYLEEDADCSKNDAFHDERPSTSNRSAFRVVVKDFDGGHECCGDAKPSRPKTLGKK